MNARAKVPWLAVVSLVAVLITSLPGLAQCYLNQGCKPQDLLNYLPNPATSQVYHGDGASNNGGGGWTTNYSDVNQCLSCHYGTDTYPYLWTGHKNTLRKFAPGALWGGPDGTLYPTTDSYYGSGSTYDWVTWLDYTGLVLPAGYAIAERSSHYRSLLQVSLVHVAELKRPSAVHSRCSDSNKRAESAISFT